MLTRSLSALTKTKNWWPSSSIWAAASSSNIGSIAKRFVLTIWGSRSSSPSRRRSSRRICFSCSGRARTRGFSRWSTARRSSLSTTSSTPARWLTAAAWRPEGATVDDERDLDDVGVGRAAVLLDRELDEGVRSVVEDPLEALQLALRVGASALGNLDVLPLDDRPHAHLPGRREVSLTRNSDRLGGFDGSDPPPSESTPGRVRRRVSAPGRR